jgi:hypothetical protein
MRNWKIFTSIVPLVLTASLCGQNKAEAPLAMHESV